MASERCCCIAHRTVFNKTCKLVGFRTPYSQHIIWGKRTQLVHSSRTRYRSLLCFATDWQRDRVRKTADPLGLSINMSDQQANRTPGKWMTFSSGVFQCICVWKQEGYTQKARGSAYHVNSADSKTSGFSQMNFDLQGGGWRGSTVPSASQPNHWLAEASEVNIDCESFPIFRQYMLTWPAPLLESERYTHTHTHTHTVIALSPRKQRLSVSATK